MGKPFPCFLLGWVLLGVCACNKNTDQLAPKKSTPQKLVLSPAVNGIRQVEFVFEQFTTAKSDTVWMSVRNGGTTPLNNLKYVVELCKSLPQTFDGCDLQVQGVLSGPLAPGATSDRLVTWINKKIKLDSTLINTGVISFDGLPGSPLANVYHSVYSVFEADPSSDSYYGAVRGYILADGLALFRLKGKEGEQYEAKGHFIAQKTFDGRLYKDDDFLTPFELDSLEVNGNRLLYDNTNNQLNFRIKFKTPVNSVTSILNLTERNF